MQGDTGSLIEGLPWFNDPMVDPDETYQAVRRGELDIFCGHCGMMGNSGAWIPHKPLFLAVETPMSEFFAFPPEGTEYHGDPFQCPNCGESCGRPIRETEPRITWPERQY